MIPAIIAKRAAVVTLGRRASRGLPVERELRGRGWRNAEAVTPQPRENVRRARSEARRVSQRSALSPIYRILTAWQVPAGQRRRPWLRRPRPGAGLRLGAPARRPSDATLSPLSLGTRRRTHSHHHDGAALDRGHSDTRINTPRMVFCYIGRVFFEKSIYIFPEFRDTDESMSSAG